MRATMAGNAGCSLAAATEHGNQSLAAAAEHDNGVNIVFVNIDWKRDRHKTEKARKKKMKTLKKTVVSIVTQMQPAVICFCEAGQVMLPMNEQQIADMQQTVREAWLEARQQVHVIPNIRFPHTDNEPYVVAWDATAVDCRHQRILKNLFVCGEPRTAQAFLCTKPRQPDWTGIDVINNHWPSGRQQLTDSQRQQALRNLLQSNSACDANRTLSQVSFLIGGDMNSENYKTRAHSRKRR